MKKIIYLFLAFNLHFCNAAASEKAKIYAILVADLALPILNLLSKKT